ncbi:MAG: HEAT repeat domain-containing protein, partial [Acidobacteriota bacterium]
ALIGNVALSHEPPARVFQHPDQAQPLENRLEWAFAEARRQNLPDEFWVGYSIRRMMDERSWIGSFDSRQKANEVTIQELVTGMRSALPRITDEERLKAAARDALKEIEGKPREKVKHSEKKVLKEVAILLRYGDAKIAALKKASLSNLSLSFDFKGLPLFWLGESSDEQSLGLIRRLYAQSAGEKAKDDLLAAAGIHGTSGLVVPFLEGVLGSGEPESLRKQAAFWIGQQDDLKGLQILLRAARSDRSERVRKQAVFSISQVDLPEAVDGLIELAKDRSLDSSSVRREAVFWLGQTASKKATAALEEFVWENDDAKVQEQAVFALSGLPDGAGLETLIKIAKTHANQRIRKKAIFWLGESDDPRALEALIAILKGK